MYKSVKTVDDFNEKENLAVIELKNRMCKEMDQEMFNNTVLFYRFLKARNFDIDAAEKMMREMVEYKKRICYDKILQYEIPKALEISLRRSAVCYDNEGASIHYVPVGKVDFRQLMLCAKFCDIEKTFLKLFAEEEIYQDKFEKRNEIAPGYIHIIDFEHFEMKQATDMKSLEYNNRISKIFQDIFPERQKLVYAINVSQAFTFVFKIVKHVMPQELQQKIRVYHTDSWKEDLLNMVDKNELPVFLGGAKTDPDGNPLCETFINHRTQSLQPYYIHRSKRSLKDVEGVETVTVPKESKHEIPLEIPEIGCSIEWEFETKKHDIQFGIFYRRKDTNDDEEVMTMEKYDTEEYSEKGEYDCAKPGTYVVVFDNTDSWFKAKEVYYKLVVKNKKN